MKQHETIPNSIHINCLPTSLCFYHLQNSRYAPASRHLTTTDAFSGWCVCCNESTSSPTAMGSIAAQSRRNAIASNPSDALVGTMSMELRGFGVFFVALHLFKKIYGPTRTGAKHDEICFYTFGVNYNSRNQQMVENYCQGEKPPVIDLCRPHRPRHNQLESHQNRFEKIAPLDLNHTESCCCSQCEGNCLNICNYTIHSGHEAATTAAHG